MLTERLKLTGPFRGVSGRSIRLERPRFEFNQSVESRCGAVALGSVCLLPSLSSDGALVTSPSLRFHIPLIEPDRQISRIRLSDKTHALRTRRLAQQHTIQGAVQLPVAPLSKEWCCRCIELTLNAAFTFACNAVRRF